MAAAARRQAIDLLTAAIIAVQLMGVSAAVSTRELFYEVTGSSSIPLDLAVRMVSPLDLAESSKYRNELEQNKNQLPQGLCEAAGISCHSGASAFNPTVKARLHGSNYPSHRRLINPGHVSASEQTLAFTPSFMKELRGAGAYFREKDLVAGKTMQVSIGLVNPVKPKPLLPAQLSSQLFDSSSTLSYLSRLLDIPADSPLYREMATTLRVDCGLANDDNKRCIASLDDMLQWVHTAAAPAQPRHVHKLVSTSIPEALATPQMATFTHVASLLDANTAAPLLACHSLPFPFAVYACHEAPSTKAYLVSWTDQATQSEVNAIATCHMDTADFDPAHAAFSSLGMKPGDGEFCHWVAEGNPIFLPVN